MSSQSGAKGAPGTWSGRSRELVRYGIVTGAILAAVFYLFTESTGISLLYDAVSNTFGRREVSAPAIEIDHGSLANVTLTRRPPEILP